MHAYAAEHLLPYLKPGSRCLDVGSGSGYLSAVLYHLVASEDRTGKIVGIEHVSELAEWSLQNLRRDGLKKAVEDRHIEMLAGDGRKGGSFKHNYLTLPVLLGYPTAGQPDLPLDSASV